MKKVKYLLLLLCFIAKTSSAGNLVIIVDADLVKMTDEVSMVLCYGEDGDDCGAWRHYYLYKAKVRQVLDGNVSEKNILFVNSQHTYLKKKYLKNWLIFLHEIQNDEQAKKLGANYIVVGSSFKYANKYCLTEAIENYLQKESPDNSMEESKFCYTVSELKKAL